MRKHRYQDFDDGIGDESLFEDEDFEFERLEKRRERRTPAGKSRGQRDDRAGQAAEKPRRRRDFINHKAWGSPY